MNFRKTIYKATHWELWHWFVKYILIAPVYLWYCLKARSIWFFTASNPAILFGGYIGENKKDTYAKMPPGTWPKSVFVAPEMEWSEIEKELHQAHLTLPLAVKPQSGLMGFMFRKIDSHQQLREYHQAMQVPYIIQEFVDYPMEVSVFYYRFPGQRKGTITGFVKKEPLSVTGDGIHTLSELMRLSPRAEWRLEELKLKHADHLDEVLPEGMNFKLCEALNLSRGGKLVSLEHEKDEALRQMFDEFSHYAGFMYGRYDIRCHSVEELKARRYFKIIEFNGCGGEPHHVYGNQYSLWEASRILMHHWKVLYQLSTYQHALGTPYWKTREALPFLMNAIRHVKQLKKADAEFSFSTGGLQKSITRKSVELTSGPLVISRSQAN